MEKGKQVATQLRKAGEDMLLVVRGSEEIAAMALQSDRAAREAQTGAEQIAAAATEQSAACEEALKTVGQQTQGQTEHRVKEGEGRALQQAHEGVGDVQVRLDRLDEQAKGCAIDDGKILIAPGKPNLPRSFQIGQADRLNGRYPAAQAFPESFCRTRSEPVVKQRPCFHQHMIRRHQ